MRAQRTLLVENPVPHAGPVTLEPLERVANGRAALFERHHLAAARIRSQRARELDRDHTTGRQAEPMTAAFTQTTCGRPSAISRQLSPSFDDANTFPLRVPKYTPAGSNVSAVSASRSTVS